MLAAQVFTCVEVGDVGELAGPAPRQPLGEWSQSPDHRTQVRTAGFGRRSHQPPDLDVQIGRGLRLIE